MKTTLRLLIVALAAATIPAGLAAFQTPPGAPPRDIGQKAPTGTASISGTVVTDDVKPEPIRRARVTIRSDAYENGWTATTDDDGRFSIRGIPAGRYTVEASKPAWLTTNYGATRPGRPGTPIAIGDAEQRENVRLVMSRGAVITGIVLDRTGEPVPGVVVSSMRYAYVGLSGEKSLVRDLSDVTTDDQGVYRLFGLMPGDHFVVVTLRSGPSTALTGLRRVTTDEVTQALASARPGGPPLPANQPRPQLVGYAPVYFPGTVDVSRASPVKLAPAEEKGGVNIALDAVPTARVDAVPTFPENGNRQSVQIYLVPKQTTMVGAGGMSTGRRDAEGRIIFDGVTPGTYTLIARAAVAGAVRMPAPAPAGGRGAASPLPLTLYATADVTVDGRDLVVPLDLQPGMTVSGRVTFANPDRAPKDAAVRVALTSTKSGPALGVPSVATDATGAFQFEGVPTGRYRIDYSATPSFDTWSLVSATLKGREMLDAPLEIRAGENVSDLVLHFTDKPSELAGRLQTSSGQPATSYSIIVFSAAREFWTPMSRRIRSLRPATDGGFSVRGLPAGDYYIAALTDVEPGEWYDPAFLAPLVATSAKVAIRDGAKTVQDLMIK